MTPAFRDKRAITSLGVLLGDVSLAVGDAQGQLTTWFFVHTGGGSSRKLRLIHTLAPHADAVRQIVPAQRSKALLSCDDGGTAALDYMTSERRLATLGGAPPLGQVGLSPRGDALLGLDAQRRLAAWRILCPHPEISWRTLFGKVHYEGYDEPDYVWQTTGGDEYEPKMSLVPLLFGTLKATVYAMLFAVPLSLAAAAYVSHFTVPGFKQWIKPTVEIMAALPSVVIGFIAALWLAPIIEHRLGTLLLCLLSIPAAVAAFLLLWQWLGRRDWARRIAHGREFLLVAPVILLGVAAAAWVLPWLWQLLPDSLHQWLRAQPPLLGPRPLHRPVAVASSLLLWRSVRGYDWARRIAHRRRFLLATAVALLGAAVGVCLVPLLWQLLPETVHHWWLQEQMHDTECASLIHWLQRNLNLRYDQRNSIIIAIGLGFAVIPIIFSLAEDCALERPPQHDGRVDGPGGQPLADVVAGRAALGQPGHLRRRDDRLRPGGGGNDDRAHGRPATRRMIHWSPLDGMRTLSANIAVEIPEAPVPGLAVPGTLYRVLFLCAVLLFVLTFVLNTAAEVVRQRLRKRYGQY